MWLVLWLAACDIPARPDAVTDEATDAWFVEYCRLHESAACTRSRAESCGPRIENVEYEGRRDCVSWQKWRWSQCPGLNAALSERIDLIEACNAQLADFDCRDVSWCDADGEPSVRVGDCGELLAFVDELCGP